MHVDPNPHHHHHCVGQTFGLRDCLDEDATGFARADEQIVGPAEIDA